MKLYSYVVARDFGFAPNPFFGTCTLATCKPQIRRTSRCGDWIVGTGSTSVGCEGHVVFAMNVAEVLTFDKYWLDDRFECKRANLRGSMKQAYGDNIYHRDSITKEWIQEDSHHSFANGRTNQENLRRDTKADAVLVGKEFYYWGGSGPKIPGRFRSRQSGDICKSGPGHKCTFSLSFIQSFLGWIASHGSGGYLGDPAEFVPRGSRSRTNAKLPSPLRSPTWL